MIQSVSRRQWFTNITAGMTGLLASERRVRGAQAPTPAVQNIYLAKDFDFRLKPGSAAVDRGVKLPSVTDGFAGAAPDLGALEVGAALPHYGPRP